jgi:protease I
MATIGVIVTNRFEDSQYAAPVKAFREAGHKIIHIGFKAGETVKGLKKGTKIIIDQEVGGLSIDDFDALLVPDGCSSDGLKFDPEAFRFTREFEESGKPMWDRGTLLTG